MRGRVLCLCKQSDCRYSRKLANHCCNSRRTLGSILRNRYQNKTRLLVAKVEHNFVERVAVEWIAESLSGCIYAGSLKWGEYRRDRSTENRTLGLLRHISSGWSEEEDKSACQNRVRLMQLNAYDQFSVRHLRLILRKVIGRTIAY